MPEEFDNSGVTVVDSTPSEDDSEEESSSSGSSSSSSDTKKVNLTDKVDEDGYRLTEEQLEERKEEGNTENISDAPESSESAKEGSIDNINQNSDLNRKGGSEEATEKQSRNTKQKVKDKAPTTKEELRQFLGVAKEKGRDAAKKLNKINEEDARDSDLINKDFQEGKANAPVFESGAEQNIQFGRSVENENNARDVENSFRSADFLQAEENKEQAKNQKKAIDEQINELKTDNTDTYTVGEGENRETVSEKELLGRLREDKETLDKNIETINQNQVERLDRIKKSNEAIQKDRNTITESEAEQIAKNQDLSKKKNELTVFGQKTGIKTSGAVSEARMIFDTFTSGGSASADLVGASVDQFVGSDENDKTVEQVAEKEAVLETQQLKKKGFQPVDEAVEGVTSIPGIVGSAVVGGAAFSGISKGASAIPRVGNVAQKTVQGAGAVAGAYTVTKQGAKAKGEFEEGQEGKAVGTLTETTAGVLGFAKGQRGFNKYLGARKGSTEINQKNFLQQTGRDSAQGVGKFQGKTVVEKPTVRDYIGKAFGKEFRPKTEVVKSEGRYKIPTASEGSSQAKGQIKFEKPNGDTATKGFEVLSNVKQTGNTRSGAEYRVSSDNTRFKTEGRLFRNFKDKKELTKTVKEGKSDAGPKEVLNHFERVPSLSKDSNIQKIELSGTNAKSNTFSETTNFVLQKRSGGGGGASSSGGGQKTQFKGSGQSSKSGSGGSTNVRIRDVVNSEAQSYVNSQNPSKIPGQGSSGVVSGSGSGGNQAGSGQKREAKTLNAGLSGERLQSFRRNAFSKRTVQGQETQGGQQTQEGGTQIRSTSGGGASVSTGVNSTASNIVQDKKDKIGLDNSDKTGISDKTGQRTRVNVGLGQSQGQGNVNSIREKVGLNQVGKTGQTTEITNTTRTGLKPVQAVKETAVQKQKTQLKSLQSVTPTQRTPIARPGIGGIPTLNLKGARGTGKPISSSPYPRPTTKAGIQTDWFSANLVEQETDQQARFDTSENVENQLFGLKTTQEKSGKISSPKILDDNNNGGNTIW